MTPCIWLRTTHTCNRPHYDLWINLHSFIICRYLFLYWNVLKCIAICLITLIHCCLLPSPVSVLALPAHLYMYLLFTHCLPTIICIMLMSIVFFISFSFCTLLLYGCFCFFLFFLYYNFPVFYWAFNCNKILCVLICPKKKKIVCGLKMAENL